MQTTIGETNIPHGVEYHTAVSDCLSLLALLLQFPESELESGLSSGAIAKDVYSILKEAGFPESAAKEAGLLFDNTSVKFNSNPEAFREIRREYTRLFNHPDAPVIKLFEGVFLDDECKRKGKPSTGARLFVNPAALDAERCYRKAGLKKSSSINIPADCITTELEFLSHLHAERAKALAENDGNLLSSTESMIKEFTSIHVNKWIPRFFERCREESRHELYAAVGMLGTLIFEHKTDN